MPSTIYGTIGIDEYQADQVYIQTVGYDIIYEVSQAWAAELNAEVAAATAVFVERTTDKHDERYKLPASGKMQRRGGQARSAAAKASGKWDVSYPIEEFGDVVAGDRVALAYMTAAEYQRHLDGIQNRHVTTVRFELLRRLFNSNATTFVDETLNSPTLTIQPLANGDSVNYPPVIGSESVGTENHYLESGYAASAISDTNDPYVTIANELEEHFGFVQGGSNIVSFINTAQVPKTRDLTDFVPIADMGIQYGTNTDLAAMNLPASMPGRVIGRMDGSGVWVVEWAYIPANYILALHLDAPAPIVRRVDLAQTGLPQGLTLVARTMDSPLESAEWVDRFGFGCGNRLNGVAMELGSGGTYDIPTAFA